jgi:hypothetical protein
MAIKRLNPIEGPPPTLAIVYIKRGKASFKPWNLVESAYLEEAGIWKSWRNNYEYRLDRRGEHHGGDQLHIRNRSDAWAFRHNGQKSEPNKHTTEPTAVVNDIVRHVFKLESSIGLSISLLTAQAGQNEALFEATVG